MSSPVAALLFSLALTLAVEVPLAALLRVRGLDLLLVGIINCLTNPVVNQAAHIGGLIFGFVLSMAMAPHIRSDLSDLL